MSKGQNRALAAQMQPAGRRPINVLIVNRSPEAASEIARRLADHDFEPTVERIDSLEAMVSALVRRDWDLALCEADLPHFDIASALEMLRSAGLDIPVIAWLQSVDESRTIEIMRAGAHDLIAAHDMARLVPAIERELAAAAMLRRAAHAEAKRVEAEGILRDAIDSISEGLVISTGHVQRKNTPSSTEGASKPMRSALPWRS